jgi:hypothetical protein
MRICEEGFLPRKPSRRVWFAEGHGYAMQRARQQARRAHDRSVVLTCEINVTQLRQRLGKRRVFHHHGVIAIDAPIPVSVLRSHPAVDSPTTPRDLATWANHLLNLKPHKGVSPKHPGIERLSKWVINRLRTHSNKPIKPAELVHVARQWLGEYFDGVEVDMERLTSHRKVQEIDLAVEAPPAADPLEEEALACLESDKPRVRARGLKLLATLGVADLFDWCAMFLGDEPVEVQVAALRAMLHCQPDDPGIIEPYADSADKAVRAAAIAALAKHGQGDADEWYERGLKDPEPCVRMETARVLKHLDPKAHRKVFELARYDPNPEIAKLAKKLTEHKGFSQLAGRGGKESRL